jgi:hypothetical protein
MVWSLGVFIWVDYEFPCHSPAAPTDILLDNLAVGVGGQSWLGGRGLGRKSSSKIEEQATALLYAHCVRHTKGSMGYRSQGECTFCFFWATLGGYQCIFDA